MMLLYLLIFYLIAHNKALAINANDGRENFILNKPEATNDIALPVLNIYYDKLPRDWKFEAQKASEFRNFEKEIDETDNAMNRDAKLLFQVIANERNLISKIKQKVVKKQMAYNAYNKTKP